MSGTFLKTLHLEAGRHLYGGPRQVLLLLDGLRERGVGVTLACPTGSAIAAAATAAGHEVITHELGGDLDVAAISFLMRTVRELKPDLLHAHSRRGADFFGGFAASLAGVPAILTRRVDNPDTPVVGYLKYLAYTRVVAISDAVRAQLESEGLPAAKLRTIRSSVAADACQPTWTREQLLAEFSLEPTDQVVAVVAQLIPRKGHALLLQAWPQVIERCPKARLLVFGTGPLDADLKALADRNGEQIEATAGTVTFAGFRPDLRHFLGRVDLLVHPALKEALGVGVLEAQAAGVPVAAFAAGGLPEAVADAVTGLLVAPGDVDGLAGVIATLLDNPALRGELGARAAARIRREFSPERMVDAYLDLYREVLA